MIIRDRFRIRVRVRFRIRFRFRVRVRVMDRVRGLLTVRVIGQQALKGEFLEDDGRLFPIRGT